MVLHIVRILSLVSSLSVMHEIIVSGHLLNSLSQGKVVPCIQGLHRCFPILPYSRKFEVSLSVSISVNLYFINIKVKITIKPNSYQISDVLCNFHKLSMLFFFIFSFFVIRLKKQNLISVAPIHFKFCMKIGFHETQCTVIYNFFVNPFISHVADAFHHFAYIILTTIIPPVWILCMQRGTISRHSNRALLFR